jgi:hypothetical protein
MVLVGAIQANAQARATIRGIVTASETAMPVAGARLRNFEDSVLAVTDSSGAFRIAGLALGSKGVTVQAVGYVPLRVVLNVVANDTSVQRLALAQLAQVLPQAAVVEGAYVPPKLREFEERRNAGYGQFLTETDLEKHRSRRLSEVLAMIPGPRVIRGTSNAGWVASSRGNGSVQRSGSSGSAMDTRQGAPKACYATVILDGNYVFSGRPGEQLFDVNTIDPSQVAGIEYYAGAATTPIKFRGADIGCGLLVIWTK